MKKSPFLPRVWLYGPGLKGNLECGLTVGACVVARDSFQKIQDVEFISKKESDALVLAAKIEAFEEAAQMCRDICYEESQQTKKEERPGWLKKYIRPHEFLPWKIAVLLDKKAKQ